MMLVGLCPKCNEVRYRSVRDLSPKDRIVPEDFEAIGDAPPPEIGKPTICHACGSTIAFRNADELARAVERTAPARPRPPTSNERPVDAAVTTLFSAQDGEEMRDLKPLSEDRLLVVTNRRILVINLEAFLIQEVSRG